jgi:pimeloyl-ACP methyl ester carboxylesterase
MLKSFAGGTVFGELWGEGPPRVVALHGWGRDRNDFRKVLDGLDALAIDLPGFGASPKPSRSLGARGYADLIAPIFDEVEQPVVLVGHSFGGRVALQLAAAHPELIASLVLIGVPLLRRSNGTGKRPSLVYRTLRALHAVGLVGDERMERARRRFGSADYRNAVGVMRDVLVTVVHESYESELESIQQPVHLVWGAEDREVPVEVAQRAAHLLSHSDLSVIESVGHHVCLQAPQAVRSVVVEALS